MPSHGPAGTFLCLCAPCRRGFFSTGGCREQHDIRNLVQMGGSNWSGRLRQCSLGRVSEAGDAGFGVYVFRRFHSWGFILSVRLSNLFMVMPMLQIICSSLHGVGSSKRSVLSYNTWAFFLSSFISISDFWRMSGKTRKPRRRHYSLMGVSKIPSFVHLPHVSVVCLRLESIPDVRLSLWKRYRAGHFVYIVPLNSNMVSSL